MNRGPSRAPTESADKSDALQTLRALRRRLAVAKRLECVRLQRRFPEPGHDSMTGRFMESPHVIFAVHWDHELRGGCSAGVLAGECTGRPARCSYWRRNAAATRSRDGRATRFMESPHDFDAVHWDHEPFRTPGQGDPAYIL